MLNRNCTKEMEASTKVKISFLLHTMLNQNQEELVISDLKTTSPILQFLQVAAT